MTIQEAQADILDEFDMFEDWMEKYEHIITLGKELAPLDSQYETEDNLIKGCQSKVWLHAELVDGKVHYHANSDAIITKGIIALMIRALSKQSPEDIVNSDMDFVDAIGLKEHLSPTRANGLVSMIKQMKFYALAFQTKQAHG